MRERKRAMLREKEEERARGTQPTCPPCPEARLQRTGSTVAYCINYFHARLLLARLHGRVSQIMNANLLNRNTSTLVRYCGSVALCASRSSFVLRRTKKRYLAHAHCLGEEKKERSYHSAYKETGDTKLPEIDRVEKRN